MHRSRKRSKLKNQSNHLLFRQRLLRKARLQPGSNQLARRYRLLNLQLRNQKNQLKNRRKKKRMSSLTGH